MERHIMECDWRVARGPGRPVWIRHYEPHEMGDLDPRQRLCNCRGCLTQRTPRVELFTDVRLVEWPHDSARFAVLGDGSIILGEPGTVLHKDIMLCGTHFRRGDPMIFGVLQSRRGRSWEICYLQPIIPRSDEGAVLLLSRLTTWLDLIAGAGEILLLTLEERTAAFLRWTE